MITPANEVTHPLLSIEGLHKSFHNKKRGQTVLYNGLNLQVAHEELIAVIGHSGSGKSTLLNMIAGLDEPDSGNILLNGRPIHGPGSDRMMVFQGYSLLPWLTVRGNVRLAVDEVMRARPVSERAAIVERVIALVHLEEAAEKRPHELSGGMKQRVGIARALAVSPQILLMDEPFGALDPFTRNRLQEEVLQLARAERQTMFLVTHDVDEALFMCDRIVILAPRGTSTVIAADIQVPFAHPRDRRAVRASPDYHRLRNLVLDELEQGQSQNNSTEDGLFFAVFL